MTKRQRNREKIKSLWNRYKEDKSYNNLVEYKLALNRATSTFRTAKANYESKLAKNVKSN